MDSFKYSVFYVAIIILIIALVVIGLSIKNSMSQTKWPPVVGKCPDFWKFDDTSGDCVNVQDLGNADDVECPNFPSADYSNCERYNFSNDNRFSGGAERCEKQKWSNALGLNWDGITNNRNICDDN